MPIKSFPRKTVAQAKGASGEAWMGGATPGESSKALCFLIRPSRNPFHMPRRKATGDGRVFRGMHLTALRIAKVISDFVTKPWVYYSVRTFKCLGSKSRLWNSLKADYKKVNRFEACFFSGRGAGTAAFSFSCQGERKLILYLVVIESILRYIM